MNKRILYVNPCVFVRLVLCRTSDLSSSTYQGLRINKKDFSLKKVITEGITIIIFYLKSLCSANQLNAKLHKLFVI